MKKVYITMVVFLTAQQAVSASRSLQQQNSDHMNIIGHSSVAATALNQGKFISYGASAEQQGGASAEQQVQRQMALMAQEQQRQRQMALDSIVPSSERGLSYVLTLMLQEQERQRPIALANVPLSSTASTVPSQTGISYLERQMAPASIARSSAAETVLSPGFLSFGASVVGQQRQMELANVTPSSTASVVVHPTIQLFIQHPYKIFAIHISPDASVDDLKKEIASKGSKYVPSLSTGCINLISGGKFLYAGRLRDHGIKSDSTIRVSH